MTAPYLTANVMISGQWAYVVNRFAALLTNLQVTEAQHLDGMVKQAGVRDCLNRHYWGYPSDTANSMLTGSWGKGLRVRPPRDIDVLFVLPYEVYQRFELRAGNKQSQLLQEVRGVLAAKYGAQTQMRGDGQVVVIQFASMPVEVVPAFLSDQNQFLICDARGGGRYVLTDPIAEIDELDSSDLANSAATRPLIQMAKQWQRACSVPIKSFMLERLAVEFLMKWDGRRDLFWCDWMVRDFFAHMLTRAKGVLVTPGALQAAFLGEAWVSKAQTAYRHAARACDYERANDNVLAGYEWQEIFGGMIPMSATRAA